MAKKAWYRAHSKVFLKSFLVPLSKSSKFSPTIDTLRMESGRDTVCAQTNCNDIIKHYGSLPIVNGSSEDA